MRIGVFDSGLGGLTVAKEIKKIYPSHPIVYIGDTARVPWGVRSPKVIKEFALQLLKFLEKQNVDLVVIACHTASSVAIPHLKENTQLEVIGVIEPSARAAVEQTKGKIGILGTPATIKSEAWPNAIQKISNNLKVFSNSAPLLVPIVEEALENHEVAKIMIQEYMSPLIDHEVDTVVLACTHYPLLLNNFKELYPQINFVNPGIETAKSLNLKEDGETGEDEFYFTDLSDRVKNRLENFYGRKVLGKVVEIDVENLT